MDSANLNKLKIALQQVENGEEVGMAIANSQYVNYNQRLLDKINILKNISVLNIDIIKYLYNIKLTDKTSEVEPKVNAIYQLALNSGLIEEKALEQEEAKHNDENKIIGNSTKETAYNIIRSILNMNN